MKRFIPLFISLFLIVTVACNPAASPTTVPAAPTAAATVAAGASTSAAPTVAPSPGNTQAPLETPNPIYSSAPYYVRVNEGTLKPGMAIPAPTTMVVLEVSGLIGVSNVSGGGNVVKFDMATLESIGLVEYRIKDTVGSRENHTFRGVLLSDLLAVVKADPKSVELATRAIDDYGVKIPFGDAAAYPVMVATQRDGKYVDIKGFGPLRIVYPIQIIDQIKDHNEARWIYSLATIKVQ